MGAYETGAVTVIAGATSVKGTGTSFTTYASVGDLFKIRTEPTWYEVAAITNATNITLNSKYSNSSYYSNYTDEHSATVGIATTGYSGTLSNPPIIIDNVSFNASSEKFTDNGLGVLAGNAAPTAGSGTINYDTGAWTVILGTPMTASLSMTASYLGGDTLNGMSYQIIADYTPHYSFPEMSLNDVNLQHIFTKAVRKIDSAIYGASGIDHYAVTTKITDYNATLTDKIILCNATSGAFSVTLITAATNSGIHYTIKKIDSSINAVTIDGHASETIDGELTQALNSQYDALKLVCCGSNWHII